MHWKKMDSICVLVSSSIMLCLNNYTVNFTMITESMQCGYELDAKSHAGEVTSPCISIRNMEDKISGYGKKFFLYSN